jgi:hypothetical protein
LFKADQYTAGAIGQALQIDGQPFIFSRLLPGDYLVAFDNQGADVRNPFPTTFYPRGSDVKGATVIHLGAGQQVLNADLFLPEAIPTRPLRVVLDWNGRNRSQYSVPGIHPAPPGHDFTVRPLAENTYEVDLLTNRTYRLQASAACRNNKPYSAFRTEYVTVEGANPLQQEVTLTFTIDECTSK